MTVPGKGGRPKKFNRTTAEQMIAMVRAGSPFKVAAQACGISVALEGVWRKNAGNPEKDPDGEYAWYKREVERARAQNFQEAVAAVVASYTIGGTDTKEREVVKDGPDGQEVTTTKETVHHAPDIRGAIWLLENSHKVKYNPKQELEHSGGMSVNYEVKVSPGPAPLKEGEEGEADDG